MSSPGDFEEFEYLLELGQGLLAKRAGPGAGDHHPDGDEQRRDDGDVFIPLEAPPTHPAESHAESGAETDRRAVGHPAMA